MKRSASAVWSGDFKSGKGRISSESGVLDNNQYSFSTRFEEGKGTNPEELIGAAHAGCYSMALTNELVGAGLSPESVETHASVSLDQVEGGFAITKIHLDVQAKVPGASQEDFDAAANRAKLGCPVSKLLNAEITLESQLDS